MTKDRNRGITHSKWFLPSFSFVLGLVILAVAWLGGHPGEGVFGLGGLTAFGLFFLLAGRSETIRGLRGDGRDERFQRIDIHATAFAGTVVITGVIVGFIVELAHGRDGNPFTWLGALGGIAYIAAIVAMRLRG